MSSPMSHPDMCCICLEVIRIGEHAQDEEGRLWDVHAGECALKSGL